MKMTETIILTHEEADSLRDFLQHVIEAIDQDGSAVESDLDKNMTVSFSDWMKAGFEYNTISDEGFEIAKKIAFPY